MDVEIIPIDMIERKNQEAGKHWFSPDTKRFFKSKIDNVAYKKGNKAYFISSEKGPDEIRKFSVREADLDTGEVNTVGEFQAFTNRKDAMKRLREII